MSRTDKDTPAWVRAQRAPASERRENHHWNCDSGPERGNPFRRDENSHRCDIDDRHSHGWRGACTYYPLDRHHWRQSYGNLHMRERVNIGYYSPERAHVRDVLRDAVRDFNAYGETDVEPVGRQHRHAHWGSGWWD